MAPGHLVALGDLPLLDDVDAHDGVDSRGEGIFVLAGEDLDRVDDARPAMGDAQRAVLALFRLLGEDGHEELLFGGGLGLALRGDLPDEDVAFFDFGARDDDAPFVEEGLRLLAYVRHIAGDLLVAELGVAAFEFVLLDVDGGVDVVLHHALGHDDGVFVVVAVPGHVGDQDVVAEGELAMPHGGAVGDDVAFLDLVPDVDDRGLVHAGAVVGAVELLEVVGGDFLAGFGLDGLAVHVGDFAILRGDHGQAGVAGDELLHAGADIGDLRRKEGKGLTLHVRAHQSAGRVIVVEERNARRGDGDDLTGRDVDIVDFLFLGLEVILIVAGDDFVIEDLFDEGVVIDARIKILQMAGLA